MCSARRSSVAVLRDELTMRCKQPDGPAHAMPAAFYTSKAFHRVECDHIFRKEWICLGHIGEIPNRGDYYTAELVGEPLLILKDDDGTARVFSNVCRHRGHPLADGKGTRRRFVCPYHAWSYGLDGTLKSAPYMEQCEGFDKKAIRLPEFRSEIWKGFIFANLDANAAPLSTGLLDLESLVQNYHIENRRLVHQEEDRWNTNWKCLTENFMEGYHLSITHAKTLHHITPTSLCRKIPGGESYTAYTSGYDPKFPNREPFHSDLTEKERRQ
ncbi:MAG: aromatic ring-hydroxylating dioxygenase subunit alpha, partial [Kiloniellales bacterium]|nr:aromatic ring-hydroxylating dioxygenase subunit alpha [Kiloniellales bacterium]